MFATKSSLQEGQLVVQWMPPCVPWVRMSTRRAFLKINLVESEYFKIRFVDKL